MDAPRATRMPVTGTWLRHIPAGSDPLHRPPTPADGRWQRGETAAEVASLLRVPRSTVEDWARRGIVPSKKVGRRRLYVRSRIEALLFDECGEPGP